MGHYSGVTVVTAVLKSLFIVTVVVNKNEPIKTAMMGDLIRIFGILQQNKLKSGLGRSKSFILRILIADYARKIMPESLVWRYYG